MCQRWAFFAEYDRRLQLLHFIYRRTYYLETYLYVVLARLPYWMVSHGFRWNRKWERIDKDSIIIRVTLSWWFHRNWRWWQFERIKWSLDILTKSKKFTINIGSERCGLIWIHDDSTRWMSIRLTIWPKHSRWYRLLHRCYRTINRTSSLVHSIIGSLLSWMDISHLKSKFRIRNCTVCETSPICLTLVGWFNRDWYRLWLLHSWWWMGFHTQSDEQNLYSFS